MRFDAAVAAGWRTAARRWPRPSRAAAPVPARRQLGTMLLMRGAFSGDDPDVTTWTFVYRATGAPSLFVVVDATDGKVQRTWRG